MDINTVTVNTVPPYSKSGFGVAAIHRRFQASKRNRNNCDMDRMRQEIPRRFDSATTTCNGENDPD